MACTIDFRCLDEGFGGRKTKRKRLSCSSTDAMDLDPSASDLPPAKRPALPSAADPNTPAFARPTYDGVIAGKVSGRNWKQARAQRASGAQVSRRGKSMELRKKEKELRRAYKERMEELKEEIRQSKAEKRKRREEREKKKKENELRSGMKLQKITNPKTLQKIAKSKQKKLLKVVPDEILNKNPNKKSN